ncbi:MAG: hypothetical protein JO197_08605 [Acidobacteria bacterium]|nr:hypothetical protein [Acidobacteriota bacterium]MBV9478047.1 hypothetical protein [Acidobacteriota bacterium]
MKRLIIAAVVASGLLLAGGRASAQTIFVSDSFTVAANQTLQSHTPNIGGAWTNFFGGTLTINAAADNLRNTNAADWSIYANGATPPSAEYVVGAKVTFTNASATNQIMLFGRGDLAFNSGYVVELSGDGVVSLVYYQSSTRNVITSTTIAGFTLNTVHTVALYIRNARKEVFIDGVSRGFTTTNNLVTTAGVVGLTMQSRNVGEVILDDYYAGTFAPTLARTFDATAVHDHASARTLLTWRTTGEVENLGYRVWRELNGRRQLLTKSPVAGSSFLAGATTTLGAGNTYRWLDATARRDARYVVEEIDLHGRSVWHGPYAAEAGAIDSRVAVSRVLSELTRTSPSMSATPHPAAQETSSAPRRRAVQPGSTQLQQYALAASNAVKISVATRGWYRVTGSELLAAGLDANTDPRTLALYEDGLQVPITVEGDDDGKLDAQDAIRFYGIPLDSAWSAARVYWLAAGQPSPKRIAHAATSATSNAQTTYAATLVRRDKTIFFPGLTTDDGDGFFGPIVNGDAPTTQQLDVTSVAPSTPARITVVLQGGANIAGQPHHVDVSFNGTYLGTLDYVGFDRATSTFALDAGALREGANEVKFSTSGGSEDVSVVESVTIDYTRIDQAVDNRLELSVDGGRTARISGFTGSDIRVLDVTDHRNPIELDATRDGDAVLVTPSGAGAHLLVVQSADRFLNAEKVEANAPSSLHGAAGADVIIVTHPDFAAAVEPLRALRESQGLTTLVATTTDIYDELSFGAKDPHALRALFEASRKWATVPRYIVLVGDATFDSRNYIGGGAADFVPTKLVPTSLIRTASDSWFTDFDFDGVSEISIGRLPARSSDEAAVMVQKIVAYETAAPNADWTNRAVLVSDADPAVDFTGNIAALRDPLPENVQVEEVNVASEGATAARSRLLEAFDSGALLIGFAGHGSVEEWTAASLFSRTDALALDNGARLPLVIALTCLNGYFHDVVSDSLAEALLRAPNGGAIAVWASSGLTETRPQEAAADALSSALFRSTAARIGDAMIDAQRAATDADVRRTFLLFGDPATRLNRAR